MSTGAVNGGAAGRPDRTPRWLLVQGRADGAITSALSTLPEDAPMEQAVEWRHVEPGYPAPRGGTRAGPARGPLPGRLPPSRRARFPVVPLPGPGAPPGAGHRAGIACGIGGGAAAPFHRAALRPWRHSGAAADMADHSPGAAAVACVLPPGQPHVPRSRGWLHLTALPPRRRRRSAPPQRGRRMEADPAACVSGAGGGRWARPRIGW